MGIGSSSVLTSRRQRSLLCMRFLQSLSSIMRRFNKPSTAGRSSHLDLPSSNDNDDEGSTKIHKRKQQRSSNTKAIAVTFVCALIALGTLFFVADKVRTDGEIYAKTPNGSILVGSKKKEASVVGGSDGGSSSSISNEQQRFLSQQNRLLPPDSIYRSNIMDIHGNQQQLMKYAGSISLIVNVACE